MFRNKKAQIGNIVSQFSITIVISFFVFICLFSLNPVMVQYTQAIIADPATGILTKILTFLLIPFSWVIWLFGTVYAFRKAIDGESVLGE